MNTTELRSLLEKATPGPWSRSGKEMLQVHHTTRDVWYLPRSEADSALVVAAVNMLPMLLDVAEAAKSYRETQIHGELGTGRSLSDDRDRLDLAMAGLEGGK